MHDAKCIYFVGVHDFIMDSYNNCELKQMWKAALFFFLTLQWPFLVFYFIVTDQ